MAEIAVLEERDVRILLAIAAGLNGQLRADDVAHRVGYRPARTGRLAVSGTLRKLERKGLVGRIAPRDQWSTATWFLTIKAKDYLASCPAPARTP